MKLAWQKKFLHRAKQFFHCTRITARPFSRHQGIFLPTATCHPRQHTTEHRRAGSRARKEVEIVILTADHKRGGGQMTSAVEMRSTKIHFPIGKWSSVHRPSIQKSQQNLPQGFISSLSLVGRMDCQSRAPLGVELRLSWNDEIAECVLQRMGSSTE